MRTLPAYMRTHTTSSDSITRARYMRTFEYINEHAPYLGTLIGRRKKRDELAQLIGEVCMFHLFQLQLTMYLQMQNMINHTRSEDASRLKSRMGSYAAPNPDKELIHPPITDDSKSRAQMGFNHVQLGKLLCPAKHLVEYIKDPHGYVYSPQVICTNSDIYRMKNKFDSASLKVTAALWPAFLYPGNTAGEDFDPEDIIEGLFRGYLLERVCLVIIVLCYTNTYRLLNISSPLRHLHSRLAALVELVLAMQSCMG